MWRPRHIWIPALSAVLMGEPAGTISASPILDIFYVAPGDSLPHCPCGYEIRASSGVRSVDITIVVKGPRSVLERTWGLLDAREEDEALPEFLLHMKVAPMDMKPAEQFRYSFTIPRALVAISTFSLAYGDGSGSSVVHWQFRLAEHVPDY